MVARMQGLELVQKHIQFEKGDHNIQNAPQNSTYPVGYLSTLLYYRIQLLSS